MARGAETRYRAQTQRYRLPRRAEARFLLGPNLLDHTTGERYDDLRLGRGVRGMPNKITATLEVTTPLFLGGVDPTSSVELRAPSIKGALRFWWRALAWSRHGGDLDSVRLERIRSEEARLFGAAGEEGQAGKSAAG